MEGGEGERGNEREKRGGVGRKGRRVGKRRVGKGGGRRKRQEMVEKGSQSIRSDYTESRHSGHSHSILIALND